MTIYKTPATTLDDVIRQSRLKDELATTVTATIQTAITNLDAQTLTYLKSLLYEITNELQAFHGRSLTPYYEAKTFKRAYFRNSGNWCFDSQLGVYVMQLDRQHGDDVLNIASVSWNGTTVTSTYYDLPYVNQANHELHLDPDANLDTLDDFADYVTITGTWGYHDNWSDAWASTGDTVQDNPLSSSATTLNVTNGALFETYQLIKIETEYLFITSINTNALTVERGVNGTTAAAHITSTSIYKFVPIPAVAKECRRLVVRAYFLRNPINNVVVSEQAIKELQEGGMKKVVPFRTRMSAI